MRLRQVPRRTLALFAVLATSGAVLLVVAGMAIERGLTSQPTGDVDTEVRVVSPIPSDAEPAIVARVVDGDTVRVVDEPDGATGGGSIRVRLLNIDTPELARDGRPAECGAHRATVALEALIRPGDLVWMAADVEDRDVFDRPLRALWTEDGTFVNGTLVAQGWAEAVLYPPNDRFYAGLLVYERVAQRDARGLWSDCKSYARGQVIDR